ncbi:MAG: hypothetical protein HUU50_09990 [Candidatus Brocadiae bacterium]|nr:hypothetical protein [Candidatus Brocadiia bacterium]
MDSKAMFGEMVTMWKKSMESSLQNTAFVQEQSEKMMRMMMEQGANLQNEGKKIFDECLETMKKSQKEYQNNLKSQMEKLEKFVSGNK